MSIFIFSTLIIGIIFFVILGSWYNIQGPFLLHVVMLISTAVAIFSAALVIVIQPLFTSKKSRINQNLNQEAAWGREVSSTLSSPAAMLDGYVVKFINTPFLQMLGMADMADQIIGMPFTNLIHPTDHQSFANLNAEATTGKTKSDPTKIRLICADGTTLPSNASLTRMREDGQNSLTLFQFTPISATSPLTNDFESQFNYHLIIDRLEEIVFQLSAEGRIIFLNPAWESLLELKVQDCLNKSLLDFFHPEDRPMLEARLNSLTQGKRPNCTLEARLLSVHGFPNWVVMRAKTTSASAGERTSVIGTMTNIQNNKEAEASVLASRRASNSLLSHIPALVYRGRNDRFWTFEYVSDGCIDLTGYDPQDFLNSNNLNFNLIIHPDDRADVWESVNQQLGLSEKFKLIYRIVTRKGETKLVQEYGRGIFSSTGELLALEGFITEIPEQQYRVKSLLH
ncbi:PAS domain-containing protein [Methylotenera versatilis]|jgi:PAS domain S-box-containing protein|uniref:histidine kinase n=1 Tax=Methylotenera versatilis (strain 301) TaxID=666681 RepID=D7DI89_METV0|nr:PAS domain-containing protein [Methylotenera versatilis]ADI29774.1 putative PAS/PAC sensor protein [Methylotenera versatilis 301]